MSCYKGPHYKTRNLTAAPRVECTCEIFYMRPLRLLVCKLYNSKGVTKLASWHSKANGKALCGYLKTLLVLRASVRIFLCMSSITSKTF